MLKFDWLRNGVILFRLPDFGDFEFNKWSQIGLAVNIFAIVLLWKNKHMRNAFGYLCLSHEIGDIGCLLLYAFWAAPMTLFQIDLSHEFVGKAFGQFGILMWNVCVYSHLFITINRFLAIFFPFGYRRCFKGAVTVAYLGLMWFVAICNIIPYFFDGCYFSYIPDLYLWMFAPTTCGMALLYNDFLVGIAFMIVMVIVDSITYIKIYLMKRQMQSSSNRREIRFFIQACCQGCLFVCKLFTFYFLSTLNDGRWYKFATTTLVWQSAHVFDGLILILFNSEFERMLTGKTPLSSYTTHVNKRGRQSTYTYSAFTKPMTTDVTVSHL
ncbi:hypothetical protein L596_009160 [Steinernema carpocapsae]|uniref:G-protein coupled receptors family 1 profile domain-containing protein n=1 Tax=Steinernema carpocapsae TaxID=34508 RepID=A0A4U5PFR9_STECR|nr:hypothetical protein L596_009160 [Steinernema carpocapsae]